MTATMLAQLAFVAWADADAAYEMGGGGGDVDEYRRLMAIRDDLFARAEALGWSGGTDAAFGNRSEAA